MRIRYLLAALLAVLGIVFAGAGAAHAASSEHIITTLYAYPTDPQWSSVNSSAPTTARAIVDICDPSGHGPGCDGESWTAANPDWKTEISKLRTASITPLVYIPTNYGAFSVSQVEGWLNQSISYYGVYSPMFDEMSPSGTCSNGGSPEACTTYYQTLYNYAAVTKGAVAAEFNVGTTYNTSAADIFGTKEILQVFEGPATTQQGLTGFESMTWPSWMKSYPASQFAATIAAGTSSTMPNDITEAINSNIGNFYENDQAEPNPNYANLPSFWSAEVTDVANGV